MSGFVGSCRTNRPSNVRRTSYETAIMVTFDALAYWSPKLRRRNATDTLTPAARASPQQIPGAVQKADIPSLAKKNPPPVTAPTRQIRNIERTKGAAGGSEGLSFFDIFRIIT